MFLLMCVYDFSRADLMTKRLVMCTGVNTRSTVQQKKSLKHFSHVHSTSRSLYHLFQVLVTRSNGGVYCQHPVDAPGSG